MDSVYSCIIYPRSLSVKTLPILSGILPAAQRLWGEFLDRGTWEVQLSPCQAVLTPAVELQLLKYPWHLPAERNTSPSSISHASSQEHT